VQQLLGERLQLGLLLVALRGYRTRVVRGLIIGYGPGLEAHKDQYIWYEMGLKMSCANQNKSIK
jgi:hypothetical protein